METAVSCLAVIQALPVIIQIQTPKVQVRFAEHSLPAMNQLESSTEPRPRNSETHRPS